MLLHRWAEEPGRDFTLYENANLFVLRKLFFNTAILHRDLRGVMESIKQDTEMGQTDAQLNCFGLGK